MRAVADASSLIHTAKVPRFWALLRKTFEEILVPGAVYREILKGREINSPEVSVIEKAVFEGWVKIVEVASIPPPTLPENLGRGEKEAIALVEQLNTEWLLMDDRVASRTARLRGLPARSVAYLLIYWRLKKKLRHDEATLLLDDLVKSGYYLSSKDYLAIKELIIPS